VSRPCSSWGQKVITSLFIDMEMICDILIFFGVFLIEMLLKLQID
jgi:hypothetical protein